MGAKYTPGPWRYRSDVVDKGYYIQSEKAFIGNVGGGLQSKDEIKANAALISAAPELLEALKTCYASLCTYGQHPIISMQVENAIAKAEGR